MDLRTLVLAFTIMFALIAQGTKAALAQSAVITIYPAAVQPAAVPPGLPIKVTFHWYGVPTTVACTVFVHIMNSYGKRVLQDDHLAPVDMSAWSGHVSYTRSLVIPASLPEGTYTIVAGLSTSTNDVPPRFVTLAIAGGPGTNALSNYRYEIGRFRVDRNAPPPPFDSTGPATLDLTGFKLTFDDEFSTADISSNGRPRRWISHFPTYGSFGESKFVDIGPGFPFNASNGILTIQARRVAGRWESGLISSVDSKAIGFSQQYGYFEMRAKVPKGPGTWPAFWLLETSQICHRDVNLPRSEIDIMEQYGHEPQVLVTTLHRWLPGNHQTFSHRAYVPDMSKGFHNYGLMWDDNNIVWFFDGVEVFRCPTPPEAKVPMYMMVDLALGSGWPIDQTPDPSEMQVKYVRVYATK